MNKSELIDAMAAVAGLTKVDSKKALDAFIQVAGETLKVGDKLTLVASVRFPFPKKLQDKDATRRAASRLTSRQRR